MPLVMSDTFSGEPGLSAPVYEVDFAARTLKLDGAAPRRLELTPDRVAAARDALRPADTRSIRMAAENIRIFHEATRPEDTPDVEIIPGVRSRLVWRSLRSAGLYVPGGSAPLFSSLLMLAIPAQVAGVQR